MSGAGGGGTQDMNVLPGEHGKLRSWTLRAAASLPKVPHSLCPSIPPSSRLLGLKDGPWYSSRFPQGSHVPHWTASFSRTGPQHQTAKELGIWRRAA